MILLEVTPWGPSWHFGVGQGPGGKSELRDFFRHGVKPGSQVPHTPAGLSAAAFRHEKFSPGLTELMQFTQSQDMLSPSTRHGPAEPWGGVKRADGWQQGSADWGSSGEFKFPECPLIQWSSSPGFQLPSCLPSEQEQTSQLA